MEDVVYVALGVALVSAAPLRNAFRALERSQQGVLALLLVGVFAAQAAGTEKESYPFVRWGMYRKEPAQVVYYRYHGTRPDGGRELLPVARFVRVTDKRYVFLLRREAAAVQRAKTEEARARAWRRYEALVRGGVASWVRRHPEADWTRVEVTRCEVDVQRYLRGADPACEPLWQVPLGDGAGA